MTTSIDRTRACDAYAQELMASRPQARQDAIVRFVLGCNQMAQDLKQLRDHQRSWPPGHPLDENAALLERHIADEFRYTFGHPLFAEQPNCSVEPTPAPAPDYTPFPVERRINLGY